MYIYNYLIIFYHSLIVSKFLLFLKFCLSTRNKMSKHLMKFVYYRVLVFRIQIIKLHKRSQTMNLKLLYCTVRLYTCIKF